jgi:uncharacterized protein YlxP (DUF503 family)
MHVGVMRLILEIPGARSLKDKRQVVRSFKERVKSRVAVSIAEVGHLDKLQLATFGVAVVSGDAAVCEEILGRVTSLAGTLPNAVLTDRAVELIPFGDEGSGVVGGIEQAAGKWDDVTEADTIDDSEEPDTIDDGPNSPPSGEKK